MCRCAHVFTCYIRGDGVQGLPTVEGLPCTSRPVSFTGAPSPPFHRESALIIQFANLSLRGTGTGGEGSLFRITLPLSSLGGL